MAKEILDIYIEQGYQYPFVLDYNTQDGSNLESDYTCWFESSSIGKKQFSVVNNTFDLTLSEEDTGKLTNNLEPYSIYIRNNTTTYYEKLLSGRIHLDKKIRS